MIFGQNIFNFDIFGIDDFFEFGVFIVQGFNLVEMLFFKIFNFRVEIVIKFGFESFDLFSVFSLFIVQVISESFLFFPELPNLKLSFLVQSDEFHVQVTDFILLFLTVFFELPDLQFVFFVIIQMVSLDALDFHMMLVFEFTDLHVLDMFNIGDVLFEFFNFVQESSILQIA